jgi:hypothetical protein
MAGIASDDRSEFDIVKVQRAHFTQMPPLSPTTFAKFH